ncbi:PPR repeat [Musa troglodytarum]|uniref:PPR repeat n=1 Tax=Musa troglodytarum TaxID=320322 RepID=A0A9E7HUU0_9LILI|nr:PPR repeat [Musa troglodytarum]
MAVSAAASLSTFFSEHKPFEPNTEAVRQRLLRKGVFPTPKILHALRKKEAQKAFRRSKKRALQEQPPPLSDAQRRALEDDALFRTVSSEYGAVREELRRRDERAMAVSGRPWEGSKAVDLRGLASAMEDPGGGRLRSEHLEELRRMLAERNEERFRWLLVNDEVEDTGGFVDKQERKVPKSRLLVGAEEKIRLLVDSLAMVVGIAAPVEIGVLGNWSQALSVVEWVYNEKQYKHRKSRFVYTKLLALLGKARRSNEALQIFNKMQEDGQIYPDMAAYHSIAVTLGQAGLVNELVNIIECMKQKPSKTLKNMNRRNWDPCLEPDVIIYNAVLNACVPSRQWKGVFWVLEQMRHRGIKPIGATYGLAMEVEKLQTLHLTKPLEVTFTGMILSALDGGYIADCISIFKHMKDHCTPNIGTINAMLKVYHCGDMFAKAKELFEATKATYCRSKPHSANGSSLQLDAYSYKSMLEVSASAQQWEYFEHVYKEMTLCGHHLDHRKHSWLLVEASRAGKWHLLEHAFDTVLEAEQIPHVSLFIAMIFQTIAQQNFARTTSLLNGMAHASLKVSESQWASLLQRDMGRFSMERLEDLLNHLQSSNVVMEDPVPNFLKSLQYICGTTLLKDASTSADSYVASMDDDTLDEDDSDLESVGRIQDYQPGELSPEIGGGCIETLDGGHYRDESLQHDDMEPSVTDATLDLLTAHIGTPFSDLPPASEILEKWRQDRIKDDMLPSRH